MSSHRKTARWVGVFYIIATVAYSLSTILLDPILRGSDYLTKAFENENQVIIGTFLVLIDSIAVAAISIVIYPILKKHNNVLALGYIGARVVEGTLFMMNAITTLTLLTLSQEFVRAGAPDTSYYQTLGTVLLSAGNWFYLLGLGLVFVLSALILNFALYKSKLIPRWLSGWGLVGATLVFINYLLQSFGINPVEILFLPIAVQEMVFALWLIVRGFNSSAIASESA